MYVYLFFVSLCQLVKCFTIEDNTAPPFEEFDGYYWRDYNKTIPEDAFVANVGFADEQKVFIAQVLHADLLIPGVIDHSETLDAIFEYGNKAWNSSRNVKIFCTENPNELEWVETNTGDFAIDKNYIVGGYERGNKVFIGRSFYDGYPLVGKVIVHGSDPVFLHTTHEGEAIRLRNFQVLRVAKRFDSKIPVTTSDYDVTTPSPTPNSETDDQPRMSTALPHMGKSLPYYPLESRLHRYPIHNPPPSYHLRRDYPNWPTTRSWIAERFNSFKPSTSPRPRFYKEDHLSIAHKPKTVTFTDNEKCTCSKGTVIINFN